MVLVFRRKEAFDRKGLGVTAKETGAGVRAVVCTQAAWKGIVRGRVRVLSPQCELPELVAMLGVFC